MRSKSILFGFSLILFYLWVIIYSLETYGIFFGMRALRSTPTRNIENVNVTYFRKQVSFHNLEQKVNNIEAFQSDISLVILIQVHNRLIYLKELIRSLSLVEGINETLLIFSHDIFSEKFNEIVQEIKFCKVMQIFYPFSIQTHPDTFPGPSKGDCIEENKVFRTECKNAFYKDRYGHYRNASVTQTKQHWWWKINYVFNRIPHLIKYTGLVLLLEDDHYLAADSIHSLKLMQNYAMSSCPQCMLFSLGSPGKYNSNFNQVTIGTRMENFGLAFNKSTFQLISLFAEEFCKFDDYNWDLTLQYVLTALMKPTPLSMVMKASRVCHIGKCGTHFKNDNCDPTKIIQEYQNQLSMGYLFPQKLISSPKRSPIRIHLNGGWGDPRDHALCMAM